jgi:hypothetical protein
MAGAIHSAHAKNDETIFMNLLPTPALAGAGIAPMLRLRSGAIKG